MREVIYRNKSFRRKIMSKEKILRISVAVMSVVDSNARFKTKEEFVSHVLVALGGLGAKEPDIREVLEMKLSDIAKKVVFRE